MPGNLSDPDSNDTKTWPTPNYIDPEERKWLPGCAATLYAIATLAILIRILVRIQRSQSGGFGVDDGILLMGWLTFTSLTVFVILGATKYMMGRHQWDIPPRMYESIARTNFFAAESFLATQCFVKVSVLLFYRRLTQDTCSKWWGYTCIAAIAFTVAWTLSCGLAIGLSCMPPDAYWKSYDPHYQKKFHCIDVSAVNWLAGILPAVSDLYAVLLPCLLLVYVKLHIDNFRPQSAADRDDIRKLRLPPAQKIGVYIIFLAGLSVVAVSSVRTYYGHQIGSTSDVSSTLYQNYILSHLEICLGCLCATAPSLRLFYRHYLKAPIAEIGQAFARCIPANIRNWLRRQQPQPMAHDGDVDFPEVLQIQRVRDIYLPWLRTPVLPSTRDDTRLQSVVEEGMQTEEKAKVMKMSSPPRSSHEIGQQSRSSHGAQSAMGRELPTATHSSDEVDVEANAVVDESNWSWLRFQSTSDAEKMDESTILPKHTGND